VKSESGLRKGLSNRYEFISFTLLGGIEFWSAR